MKTLYETIAEEADLLRKQVGYLKERIRSYPSGALRISYSNGSAQYYFKNIAGHNAAINDSHQKGSCMKSDMSDIPMDSSYRYRQDRELAASIAQRDYDIALLKELEIRLQAIEKVRDAYDNTEPEKMMHRRYTL